MKLLLTELGSQSLIEKTEAIKAQIKSNPTSADLRAHLFQLICLQGDWAAAAKQLQPWTALAPMAQPTTAMLTQILDGELDRQAVLSGSRLPGLITGENEWIKYLAEAIIYDSQQEYDKANSARAAAYELADGSVGKITIKPKQGDNVTYSFSWIADGDNRFGPVCELIYNGRYYWLPFSDIQEIRFQQPNSATDLIWRHVSVSLKDGRDQVCQLPARYPLPENKINDDLLLGHRTEWEPLNGEDFYLGLGQKMFTIDEMEFPILDVTLITFD